MQRPGRPGGDARLAGWRIPVLVGLGAALLSVTVGHALALREEEQLGLVAGSGARRVRSEVRAGLNARMHALSILAREWQDRFLPMRGAWESDVRLILSQSPGLESIAWVEPDGRASWLYPPGASLPPFDLESLGADGTALRRPVMASAPPGPDGEPRLRILAPLVESGEHEGWLVGTYRSQDLLAEILSNANTSFAVVVSTGDSQLFRVPDPPLRPGLSREAELTLPGGLALRVRVEPSDEMRAARRTFLPAVTLAGGLLLSVLLALALGLRNVASVRARALEIEIHEHERAEEEIRRLNRELEERVRQRTAELSRSNEDLKQFASFLSHELRQPVGAQAIWADLLESEYAGALDDEGRRYVGEIRACAGRMSELISAQLPLAAASSAELESHPTDLEMVLREVLAGLEQALDGVGAAVRSGPLPSVVGDSRQFCQLFRNLLENAVKYRRPDVPLEVSVRAAPSPGSGVEIVVEDNGCGFSAEEARRIFDPAERLDREEGGGHGLGLTLCRRIVERHGGELRAEGRPGEGARFRIRLPASRLTDRPSTESGCSSYR